VHGGIAGLNLRFLPCGGVLFDVLGVGGGFDRHNDVDIVMTTLFASAQQQDHPQWEQRAIKKHTVFFSLPRFCDTTKTRQISATGCYNKCVWENYKKSYCTPRGAVLYSFLMAAQVATLLLVSATVVVVVLHVLTIVRRRRRAKVDKQVVSGGSC
jgi:hypothetical protein